MKKKILNWMDCNCECHGDWGDMPETVGKTCPHCSPELYPDWESDPNLIPERGN